MCRMSDVTYILSQIESGDPKAAEQLLPLVYDELRKLAAAKLASDPIGCVISRRPPRLSCCRERGHHRTRQRHALRPLGASPPSQGRSQGKSQSPRCAAKGRVHLG